ncbi:MAG: hypothetical protein Aurels2KO_32210 [Aureliella sp.]
MAARLVTASICLCVVSISQVAKGDLAFPSTGTEIFAGEYVDDVVDDRTVLRSTGLSNFRFFGKSLASSMYVSENGNISSVSNVEFFPRAHNSVIASTQLIAPMWDDVILLNPTLFPASEPVNNVREYKSSGLYAVTWQNIRLLNETVAGQPLPTTVRSAQVALISTAQTLRGFAFQPNDIVFSYRSYDGTTNEFVDTTRSDSATHLNAFVGLADTTANTGAAGEYSHLIVDGEDIDADDSGFVEADEAAGDGSGGRLPWDNQEFVLFREQLDSDGNFTGYDVTIERFTAVPEPGIFPVGCIVLLLQSFRRRRAGYCT